MIILLGIEFLLRGVPSLRFTRFFGLAPKAEAKAPALGCGWLLPLEQSVLLLLDHCDVVPLLVQCTLALI